MSQIIELKELKTIVVPPATDTYQPIAHYDLVKSVSTISSDLLRGYELVSETYTVARDGNQLFAVIHFRGDSKDANLAVGFTNSLDKSLALKFIVGNSIIVCSNLMFAGSSDSQKIIKKHSKNLLVGLEDEIITLLYRANYCHGKLIEQADVMRGRTLTNEQAGMMTGLLFWNGVLSPRMIPTIKKEWNSPQHDEFKDKNLFNYYMHASEALKQSAPGDVTSRHINLHKTIMSGREVWA